MDDRMDVSMIAKELTKLYEEQGADGGGHRNSSGWTINGQMMNLPYKIIDRDGNLINMMNHSVTGLVNYTRLTSNNENEVTMQLPYVELTTPNKLEKRNKILEQIQFNEYIDLLKRKFKSYQFIVIKDYLTDIKLGKVEDDNETIKQYNYFVIYNNNTNDNSQHNHILAKLHNGSENTYFEFMSHLSFVDLMQQCLNITENKSAEYIQEEYENDQNHSNIDDHEIEYDEDDTELE